MIKIIYVLFIVVLCFILTTVRVTAADDTNKKTEDDVKLQATVILDAGVTTMRFILTNTSTEPIEVYPILINNNGLIMTLPNRKKISISTNKFGLTPKIVDPHAIIVWDVKINDCIFDRYDLTNPGVYGLVWKVGKYVSNEVLLVKEEKK
jgi:hypothetical protein